MSIATRLGPIALEDSATGRRTRLATLWQDAPTVLIFLRHFG